MDRIDEAFEKYERSNFLPRRSKEEARLDIPIPIGHGQTISQPYTVRLMLQWLSAQEGNRVLDVGSGSGWTTALLSYLVGNKGYVYAVEKVPELVKYGEANCRKVGVGNARFFEASDNVGLEKYAPYDRILVSAAAHDLPQELVKQLKVGGTLVIPVKSSIFVITKKSKSEISATEHKGFAFVPLI